MKLGCLAFEIAAAYTRALLPGFSSNGVVLGKCLAASQKAPRACASALVIMLAVLHDAEWNDDDDN